MKLVFQILGCWIVLSCVVVPCLTWAFFHPARRARVERAERVLEQHRMRKARHDEVTAQLAAWLTSTDPKART